MEQTPQTTLTKDPRSGEALTVRRLFTQAGVHPFDTVEWEIRDAIIDSGMEAGLQDALELLEQVARSLR